MPYAVIAEQAEVTEEALFIWTRAMERGGYLRGVAATLQPRRRGASKANALVVWQAPGSEVDATGAQIARFRQVGHCSMRPIYASWPYALFTTIRAKTYGDCMGVVKQIEERVGQFPHKSLFSTQEYKRVPIQYFSPALDAWWRQVAPQVNPGPQAETRGVGEPPFGDSTSFPF